MQILKAAGPDRIASGLEAVAERILLCRGTRRSNCIGTALYIAGEQDRDEGVDMLVAYESKLKGLKRVSSPVELSLMSWQIQFGEFLVVNHMGVVSSVDPLLITNRISTYGHFIESQQFSEIYEKYKIGNFDIAFYLPRIISDKNVDDSAKGALRE